MIHTETMRELSPEDRALLEAVIVSPSIPAAAEALGISRATLYRRLQDPQLREAVRKARAELFTGMGLSLHVGAGEAVQLLREVMGNQQASPASRVRAAEVMLEMCLRTSELMDIQEELDELRRAYERLKN